MTINVTLALVITLVHAMLWKRLISPSDRFHDTAGYVRVTIDVAQALIIMLVHAMRRWRCLSPSHCYHACADNAWVTVDVALGLLNAIACNASVTINVDLALVIMLVHAVLGWRMMSPSHCFMLVHAMLE